jgi:hypothetical protein
MNIIYIAHFDMKTSMHSIRNKVSSKKVSQDMIKVGISKNFIERKKQYENTYRCLGCNKTHALFVNKFETKMNYDQCREIEKKVREQFKIKNLFGEYYKKDAYNEIEIFLTNIVNDKKPDSILRHIPPPTKEMSKSKPKSDQYFGCKFFRTNVEVNNRHALHNIKRWEWIDNDGKGRTYNEINIADSTYRKCIKDSTYHGNTSSIDKHLTYDRKMGMIEIQ